MRVGHVEPGSREREQEPTAAPAARGLALPAVSKLLAQQAHNVGESLTADAGETQRLM